MINNTWTSAKSFFLKCKRVWFALKKPSRKEFEMITKVSALGILLIGVIGFMISILMDYIFVW